MSCKFPELSFQYSRGVPGGGLDSVSQFQCQLRCLLYTYCIQRYTVGIAVNYTYVDIQDSVMWDFLQCLFIIGTNNS